MPYSKEVVKRFEEVLNSPKQFSVGRFDPNDPDVATGMTGAHLSFDGAAVFPPLTLAIFQFLKLISHLAYMILQSVHPEHTRS